MMPITQLSFFFQLTCPLHHFIIIRRYSRACVVLVYSDFPGGWNHSAPWTRESRSTHSLANPPPTHVTSHLIASTQPSHSFRTTGSETPKRGSRPCTPAPAPGPPEARSVSLGARDERSRLAPKHLQGCLNFVGGRGGCCVDLVIPGGLLQVFKTTPG